MHTQLNKKNMTTKNSFIIGAKYNASQNISRLALGNGHTPLFYEGLVYQGYNDETNDYIFDYNGVTKWFDVDFVNNGKAEDNSIVIAYSKNLNN